ncbi:hypothetical protein Taro_046115 [Colocasia esculenta]|uniref:Protein TIFY n=1 Tax=Colocasia esculenta TaxID=4460 RepID=A0A843WRD7_COLES|nr:hypothetical protein [Colocasia esculenta]
MDLSFGKDAPAAMTPAEEVEKTQWEQKHRGHRNSERLEAEEVQKEKGEVATQMDRCEEENADRLPVAAASTSASAPFSVACNPTQLAIFFDGSVCVYDDIPLERVQAILLIAAATASAVRTSSPVLLNSPSLQSSSTSPHNQQQLPENTVSSICKLQAELPLARRNSLQRFLEKRRDRVWQWIGLVCSSRVGERGPVSSRKIFRQPGEWDRERIFYTG